MIIKSSKICWFYLLAIAVYVFLGVNSCERDEDDDPIVGAKYTAGRYISTGDSGYNVEVTRTGTTRPHFQYFDRVPPHDFIWSESGPVPAPTEDSMPESSPSAGESSFAPSKSP